VNTFHFDDTNSANGAANIETLLFSFYDDIQALYSSDVAQNGHTLKVYDLNDPQPRAPILEETYNFTAAPSGGPLPHQLAIVMSFQGDRSSGVSQARRRGRVYLGPLKSTLVATGGRFSPSSITTINTAAEDLLTAANLTTTNWVVWSPTSGASVQVTNGWCDDTFDIQRRRQRDATSRNVWP
jgi:hypothetical protein